MSSPTMLVLWEGEIETYCGRYRIVATARDAWPRSGVVDRGGTIDDTAANLAAGQAWTVCEQLHRDCLDAPSWRPADTARTDHAMRAALLSLWCEVHHAKAPPTTGDCER